MYASDFNQKHDLPSLYNLYIASGYIPYNKATFLVADVSDTNLVLLVFPLTTTAYAYKLICYDDVSYHKSHKSMHLQFHNTFSQYYLSKAHKEAVLAILYID